MSDKKQSAKRKWKNALLAAALTASVILALPAWSVGPAEATTTGKRTSERLDWMMNPTLTITSESAVDLDVDLYLVATAEPVAGYDTYTLKLQMPYDSEAPEGEKSISDLLDEAKETEHASVNASYRNLAQKVAAKAFESDKRPDSTIKLRGESKEETAEPTKELQAGMYLVVPHGKGMTPEQYIRKMTTDVANEDAPDYYGESGDKYVTIAFSERYVYSYLPELISIPSKENNGGDFNTAQASDWIYDVTAMLKSEQDAQMTSLEITKTLNMAPLTSDSCVFHIVAELDEKTVYESYKSVSFGKGETVKTVRLEQLIPLGSKITVTEVFTGASYAVADDNEEVIENAVPDTIRTVTDAETNTATNTVTINNRVEFTNNRQDFGSGSGAITNNFKYDGNGGWQWTPDPRVPEADTTDDNA